MTGTSYAALDVLLDGCLVFGGAVYVNINRFVKSRIQVFTYGTATLFAPGADLPGRAGIFWATEGFKY